MLRNKLIISTLIILIALFINASIGHSYSKANNSNNNLKFVWKFTPGYVPVVTTRHFADFSGQFSFICLNFARFNLCDVPIEKSNKGNISFDFGFLFGLSDYRTMDGQKRPNIGFAVTINLVDKLNLLFGAGYSTGDLNKDNIKNRWGLRYYLGIDAIKLIGQDE